MSESEARELRTAALIDAELALALDRELDHGDALGTLGAIVEATVREDDRATELRARRALGLAAVARGDLPEAIVQLTAVVESGELSCLRDGDAYAALGKALVDFGAPSQAVALYERCFAEIEAAGDPRPELEIRFATYLSYALSDLGEATRAREVLSIAHERAGEIGDTYMLVRLHWAIARVADLESRASEAIRHYREAISLLETTEDTVYRARAHVNCAEAMISQEKALQAGGHLDAALRLYGDEPAAADLGLVRVQQARRANQLGQPLEAAELARQSLELLALDYPLFRAGGLTALADSLVALGDIAGAEQRYREAVGLLSAQCQRRELNHVLRTWAKALHRTGRSDRASEVLARIEVCALRPTVGHAAS